MNGDLSRRAALVGLGTLLAGPLRAQGFAGLGTSAEGFALPRRNTRLAFPADHAPHPAFRIEWWYLTANLRDAAGVAMGLQWTLFRTALAPGEAPGWQSPQLWMGHAAVTTADTHRFAEKRARGGTGQAGVTASPFAAWIDDWELAGPDLSALTLTAKAPDFDYRLRLSAQAPLVLHGQDGYSVKSAEGQASHYYSQPDYRAEGRIDLGDGAVAATGHAWLDREWSSQPLAEDQSGWDWFSLRLSGGVRLMAFRLRGGRGDFTSATWISPDGSVEALPDGSISLEALETAPVSGRRVPIRWRLRLPARGLNVEVAALNPRAWMGTTFPYWEGPVSVSGSKTGEGYLEMTGY